MLTSSFGNHTDLGSAVLVLRLARVDEDGTLYVEMPDVGILAARCVMSLGALPEQLTRGTEAIVVMEQGDPARPIVVGLLAAKPAPPRRPASAEVDGRKVTFTADEEVTLRCGRASITLTRAGKVLISGDYVLSRSRGVNRIKGGSVQIN
jgi:hypothetical protein